MMPQGCGRWAVAVEVVGTKHCHLHNHGFPSGEVWVVHSSPCFCLVLACMRPSSSSILVFGMLEYSIREWQVEGDHQWQKPGQ